jgi:hypothetical protein
VAVFSTGPAGMYAAAGTVEFGLKCASSLFIEVDAGLIWYGYVRFDGFGVRVFRTLE